MLVEAHQKVLTTHLKRNAYLYIRQSTMRQVMENTESTKRQYALRQKAVALGWTTEQVIVIDNDLGQSGAHAADREGFQRLVSDVGLGKAGIVLGLEVSRLARNSTDWHRLLEICALTRTLICDEDGLYDPCSFNDRLLLGLKGTMSEAELHILSARMRGGILNKARRGELKIPPPVGLVYDDKDRILLDPDQQVQQALRRVFESFRRLGSAFAVVKEFRASNLLFPRRPLSGPRKGELLWSELYHFRVLQILHNPRYAGAFVFGRFRCQRDPDGRYQSERRPREDWAVVLPDAHAGYLSWDEYLSNREILERNLQARDGNHRKCPPREGPALLQGLALCGMCGKRMTVRYHTHKGRQVPEYACQSAGIQSGTSVCQVIYGQKIDEAIGTLLLERMTPLALELACAVQKELESRLEETDRLRRQQVERARYEVDLARRRYLRVDPDNRLVADSLEADWNEKLKQLEQVQEAYERQKTEDQRILGEEEKAAVLALAQDFPKLWTDPRTDHREQKRLVHFLIEDVTLLKKDRIHVHVRFKGETTHSLSLPAPLKLIEWRKTDPAVVARVDQLIDEHTDREIADILTREQIMSWSGQPHTQSIVFHIRRTYKLGSRFLRLKAKGLLTARELGTKLDVNSGTICSWRRKGLIQGVPYDDSPTCLFDPDQVFPEVTHPVGFLRKRSENTGKKPSNA
jgi:DNA invertase Pin-like site-specific DNA recombinase